MSVTRALNSLMQCTYLTRLGVMFSVDPPFSLECQFSLEILEQICRHHSPAGEKVCGHPAFFVVVRGVLVAEDVGKKFTTWLQSPRDLGHEELVVFHMFEHLFPSKHALNTRQSFPAVEYARTSMDTTLSKLSCSNSYSETSPVMTVKFLKPFSLAWALI